MLHVENGQCGMCAHFGEHQAVDSQKIVQIRTKKEAPVELREECGHPKHVALHLLVTANSACDGFQPAAS
jgi:hypothetical protein